ncbi:Voltage-gated Ion Channel [Phytophthora megakarya]|uniref:Voltage-gated Ion Channel n=1 Tax=Phytophthora megakarya TaxID=4795 RepID=A0A225WVH0_9STRA|nr:Voltage-gated Ion Channel [Phytophthora megakarya]
MDGTLPSYEAAMREARAYLRRRDLSSQEEIPLYFAWQRLYAAANANLSTDFLQETKQELRARQEARLAPRRGIPPPLFTSFDKVRRTSAQASAYLRTKTSSDVAIEMMARRYRREAEKLRSSREKLISSLDDADVKKTKPEQEVQVLLERFAHRGTGSDEDLPSGKSMRGKLTGIRSTDAKRIMKINPGVNNPEEDDEFGALSDDQLGTFAHKSKTRVLKPKGRLGVANSKGDFSDDFGLHDDPAKTAEWRGSSLSNVANVAAFAARVSDWRMPPDIDNEPQSTDLSRKRVKSTTARWGRLSGANELRESALVDGQEGDMTLNSSAGSSGLEDETLDLDDSPDLDTSTSSPTGRSKGVGKSSKDKATSNRDEQGANFGIRTNKSSASPDTFNVDAALARSNDVAARRSEFHQKLIQLSHAVGDMEVKIQGKQIEVTFKGALDRETESEQDGIATESSIKSSQLKQPSMARTGLDIIDNTSRERDVAGRTQGAHENDQYGEQFKTRAKGVKQSDERSTSIGGNDNSKKEQRFDGQQSDKSESDRHQFRGAAIPPAIYEGQLRQIQSSTTRASASSSASAAKTVHSGGDSEVDNTSVSRQQHRATKSQHEIEKGEDAQSISRSGEQLENHSKRASVQHKQSSVNQPALSDLDSDDESDDDFSDGPDTPNVKQHLRKHTKRELSRVSHDLEAQKRSKRSSSQSNVTRHHGKRNNYTSESDSANNKSDESSTDNDSRYEDQSLHTRHRSHNADRTQHRSQRRHSKRTQEFHSRSKKYYAREHDSRDVYFPFSLDLPPKEIKPTTRPKRNSKTWSDLRCKKPYKIPEDIVWPPGMEEECIARLGLNGHHPIAPPGLEHLVTEEQWGDYWTWLHWYSSWQMWYMKNDKTPKRKSGKEKRSEHHRASMDEYPDIKYAKHGSRRQDTKAQVGANWWVDIGSRKHEPLPQSREELSKTIINNIEKTEPLQLGPVETLTVEKSPTTTIIKQYDVDKIRGRPRHSGQGRRRFYRRIRRSVMTFFSRDLPLRRSPESIRAMPTKARLNFYLSNPEESLIGWRLQQLTMILLFVNICVMAAETVDGPRYGSSDPGYAYMPGDSFFNPVEAFFSFIYVVEFVVRWLTAPNQTHFWKTIPTWITFLAAIAALPRMADLGMGSDTGLADKFMYNMRILRAVRLIVLAQAYAGTKVLFRAVEAAIPPLTITMFFLITVVMVFATAIFYAEPCYDLQTCTFTDILNTGYFVMLTVATVGYGNQIPSLHNAGSLLLVCMVMIFGTIYFSMPLAIVGIKYELAWAEHDEFVRNSKLGLDNRRLLSKQFSSKLSIEASRRQLLNETTNDQALERIEAHTMKYASSMTCDRFYKLSQAILQVNSSLQCIISPTNAADTAKTLETVIQATKHRSDEASHALDGIMSVIKLHSRVCAESHELLTALRPQPKGDETDLDRFMSSTRVVNNVRMCVIVLSIGVFYLQTTSELQKTGVQTFLCQQNIHDFCARYDEPGCYVFKETSVSGSNITVEVTDQRIDFDCSIGDPDETCYASGVNFGSDNFPLVCSDVFLSRYGSEHVCKNRLCNPPVQFIFDMEPYWVYIESMFGTWFTFELGLRAYSHPVRRHLWGDMKFLGNVIFLIPFYVELVEFMIGERPTVVSAAVFFELERGTECFVGRNCMWWHKNILTQEMSEGFPTGKRVLVQNTHLTIIIDMLRSTWFSLVTFTTVGYGDLHPRTSLGKLVDIVGVIFSSCYTAMPLTLVGGQFYVCYEVHAQEKRLRKVKKCETAVSRIPKIDSPKAKVDTVDGLRTIPLLSPRTDSIVSLPSTAREDENVVSGQSYTHTTEVQMINSFFMMQKVFHETIKDISLLNQLGIERVNSMRKLSIEAATTLADVRQREQATETKIAENMEFCVTACMNFAGMIERITETKRTKKKKIIHTNALLAAAEQSSELMQTSTSTSSKSHKSNHSRKSITDDDASPNLQPKGKSFKRVATLSKILAAPNVQPQKSHKNHWAEFTNKKDHEG